MKQWECIDKAGKVVVRLQAPDLAKATALAHSQFNHARVDVAEIREADVPASAKPKQDGPARDPNWKPGVDNNAPKAKASG